MDHKGWLWRKNSTEELFVSNNRLVIPSLGTIEKETYPTERGSDMERPGKYLNEKLASVLLDSQNQEGVVGNFVPKKEMDEASRHRRAANGISKHSDDALTGCMDQLTFVPEEHQKRIHDAVMITSREYEKSQNNLEVMVQERDEQVTNLAVENINLTMALRAKEKFVEDLCRKKSETDVEYNALMDRLDSTEKENAILRCEFHMLEKEFEIQSEEMEYNRQSAEASHNQHMESMMKTTELGQECQRLNLQLRKRLQLPASMNMKNEVKMTGRDRMDMGRRKRNPSGDVIVRDVNIGNTSYVIELLCNMEEENKSLRDTLTRKNSELHSLRSMHTRIESRLSQAEKSMELVRHSHISNDQSNSLQTKKIREKGEQP